jgi:hypothetical protein
MSDDMLPPESDESSSVPGAPAQVTETGPQVRQPLNPGLLILGLVTPWVLSALGGVLVNALAMAGLPTPGLSIIGGIVPLGVLGGMIAAFVRGRATGNSGLRSFGLGGIISLAATMLLSLLAFGACFVTGVFG